MFTRKVMGKHKRAYSTYRFAIRYSNVHSIEHEKVNNDMRCSLVVAKTLMRDTLVNFLQLVFVLKVLFSFQQGLCLVDPLVLVFGNVQRVIGYPNIRVTVIRWVSFRIISECGEHRCYVGHISDHIFGNLTDPLGKSLQIDGLHYLVRRSFHSSNTC